ncbi:MAG: hypothetical protein ACM31E_06245 [Fibrobacterota bacterium]|nr:hypothetical protein [Chitinispirillaceae bacterium]
MIERRAFLQAIASLMAGAVIARPEHCHASDAESIDDRELQLAGSFDNLDLTIKMIGGDTRLNAYNEYFKLKGHSPFLIQEVIAALTIRSAMDHLTEHEKKSPLTATMLQRYAPLLDRAVLGMTTFIETFTETECVQIAQNIDSNQDILESLHQRFGNEVSKKAKDHSKSLRKFDRTMRFALWRIRHLGLSSTIQTCVAEIDNVCKRMGISKDMRRAQCKEWNNLTDFFENRNVMVAEVADSPVEPGTSPSSTKRNNSSLTIGLVLLGAGLLVTILSAIATDRNNKAIVGVTAGVLAMLIGLIVTIAGLSK